MTEPTTPTPAKPKVDLPAGWVAFVNVAQKRAIGITQFTFPSVAYTDALIVSRPTVEALLAELTRLGYTYPKAR